MSHCNALHFSTHLHITYASYDPLFIQVQLVIELAEAEVEDQGREARRPDLETLEIYYATHHPQSTLYFRPKINLNKLKHVCSDSTLLRIRSRNVDISIREDS